MQQPQPIRSISQGTGPEASQKETLLIEILLSGLDLRANATQVGSPMLTYLTDLLVMRAREELEKVAAAQSSDKPEREGAA